MSQHTNYSEFLFHGKFFVVAVLLVFSLGCCHFAVVHTSIRTRTHITQPLSFRGNLFVTNRSENIYVCLLISDLASFTWATHTLGSKFASKALTAVVTRPSAVFTILSTDIEIETYTLHWANEAEKKQPLSTKWRNTANVAQRVSTRAKTIRQRVALLCDPISHDVFFFLCSLRLVLGLHFIYARCKIKTSNHKSLNQKSIYVFSID